MPPFKKSSDRAMALIISLMMISICTMIVVSFLSYSKTQLILARSQSSQLLNDSQSSQWMKVIVASLLQEVYQNSIRSTEGSTYRYTPKESRFLLPQQAEIYKRTGQKILAISGDGSDLTSSVLKSSSIPTDLPSKNGICIDSRIWAASHLAAFEELAPKWIYCYRKASSTKNKDAQGRFAYVIYDLNSSVDINALQPDTRQESVNEFGGLSPYLNGDKITSEKKAAFINLANWKAPEKTIDAHFPLQKYDSYLSTHEKYLYEFASPHGYQRAVQGGNLFLNRKDLMRGGRQFFQFPNETVQELTTFSRYLNEPDNQPQALVKGGESPGINVALEKFHVKKPFDRRSQAKAVVGEPLLKTKFPISACRYLTPEGVKEGVDSKIVLSLFGLRWNAENASWDYLESVKNNSIQGRIKTFSEIQAENREPNFFEILKVGILDKSLGLDAGPGIADMRSVDQNVDFQIFRIGLNLIDQFDGDSYPTIVSFSNLEFAGQESLPYPHKIVFYSKGTEATNPAWGFGVGGAAFASVSPGTITGGHPAYQTLMLYELWNPNQTPLYKSSLNVPKQININQIQGGLLKGYRDWWGNWRSPNTSYSIQGKEVSFAYGPSDFKNPGFIKNGNTLKVADFLPSLTGNLQAANGEVIEYPATDTAYIEGNYLNTWVYPSLVPQNVAISVGYLTPSGLYKSYQMYCGVPKNNSAYTAAALSFNNSLDDRSYIIQVPSVLNPETDLGKGNNAYFRLDPRTLRFGLQKNDPRLYEYFTPGFNLEGKTVRPEIATPAWNGGYTKELGMYAQYGSIPWSSSTTQKYFGEFYNPIAQMAENRHTVAGPNGGQGYYLDRDGVQRWGDSALDPGALSGNYTINPMAMNSSTNRPIILDRMPHSAGEIGYVHRDMPWKSLDLFTENSADAGLLDLFSATEEPRVSSGRLNFNALSEKKLAALLAGVVRSPQTVDRASKDLISDDSAAIIARQIRSKIQDQQQLISHYSEMVTKLATTNVTADFPASKSRREAPLRAVTEATQVRAWNIMIDLVYQSGKIPRDQTSLEAFEVEASQRYWLHVAIDRKTGTVIDYDLETASN